MSSNKIDVQAVTDPAHIDLTRHALIEASAGTGKTYTIEHLVLRVLKEEPAVGLENILLVTFTEKAACELKLRLYERIRQQARSTAGPVQTKLQNCLDGFDAAAIDTIHGFCNGLLQDFAFENQSLFHSERIDDPGIWDTALAEVMRRDWPRTFGPDLTALLDITGFSRRRTRFLQTVTAVARAFRPQVGDVLRPDTRGRGIAQIKADLEAAIQRLGRLVDAAFIQAFGRLNIHPGTKKAILGKVIGPLAAFVCSRQPGGRPLDLFALAQLVAAMRAYNAFEDKGPACLIPTRWLKKGENLQDCPRLEQVVAALEALVAGGDLLAHFLALEAIGRLPARVRRIKEDKGAISFEDMLTRVWQALEGPGGALLRQRLRARFAVAFVDEFQDTDPIQWRILEDVFLTSANGANRLFLIGDPKQAIYAFRGADVYAYFEARRTMADLWTAGRAGLYRLETNWRSTAALVDAFNKVFSQPAWFGTDTDAFGYSPSRGGLGPGPDEPQACLQVLDLRHCPHPVLARQVMARWCADTIGRLVAEDETAADDQGVRRSLHFGDIAVLVRTRAEMPALERAFRARGIPYSTYKKPGLFTCAQAHHLRWVLNAIAAPTQAPLVKKALLTPFCRIDPENVSRLDAPAPSSALGKLLAKWVELARQRRWSQLFQSIEIDGGFVFRQSTLPDWGRIRANYRQLVEYLTAEAHQRNLDIRGLADLMDANRRQSGAEGSDLHQIDAEGGKVQLMTIHVSKGLEFAVVFVAGGLTRKPRDHYHRFHRRNHDGRFTRVIDLSSKDDPRAHWDEQTAEDKRLFYVAMTRACRRVYVPYYPVKESESLRGPMTGFGADALAQAFDPADPRNAGFWITPEAPAGAAPAAPAIAAAPPSLPDGLLLPPVIGDFRPRRIRFSSFSGLRSEQPHVFSLVDANARTDDEPLKSEPSGSDGGAAAPVLPGGAAMGTVFHEVFESIDFGRAMAAAPDLLAAPDLAALIRSRLTAHRLDLAAAPAVAGLVADALAAPIRVDGERFRIGHLCRADRLHEAGFCFPFPAGQDRRYVRGAIDLIFRLQDRYFIADWKSNYLEDGYGPASLEACMNGADYRLQYLIYAVAGLRFLRLRLAGFDAERHFGGIFYLFIRGMGRGEGVYFIGPDQLGSPSDLEARLAQRLNGPVTV